MPPCFVKEQILRYYYTIGKDGQSQEKIEEKDAKIAIDFTEKFLQCVYVIPEEIEEIEGEVSKKPKEP